MGRVFDAAGLDISEESPGRKVVRQKGEALVAAVQASRAADDPKIGELVAAESVVEAESKDHQNWELLGRMVEHLDGDLKDTLAEAYEEVAEQEAHHLFHTMGWARELWLDYLGVPAALPLDRLDLLRRHLRVERTEKTPTARRTVTFPTFLAEELARHLTTYPPTTDHVFTMPDGSPLHLNRFRDHDWYAAVDASVGRPMRPHDLRHTHVALLIAAGEDPYVISKAPRARLDQDHLRRVRTPLRGTGPAGSRSPGGGRSAS